MPVVVEIILEKVSNISMGTDLDPNRNEPGTGEINYPFLFEFLDKLGYDGWIGCEYKPKAGTDEGLGWVEPYLKA